MTEPTPDTPPLPADVAQFTPEQARSEIERIRTDTAHVWHQPGHRQYGEAQTRMSALYQKVHGTAAAADGPPSEAPPTEPDPHAMPDPHAEPTTAAEALQVPPPQLSEAAKQQGITWDAEERQRVYAEAEHEGLIPFTRQAEQLFAELVGQPMPTAEEAEDRLYQQRGAARVDAENRRAAASWRWLEEKLPATAARLTQTGLRNHERTWDWLLELDAARYDGRTDRGLARIKARGLAAIAAEARKAAR